MKRIPFKWILIAILIIALYFVNKNRIYQIETISKNELNYNNSLLEKAKNIENLRNDYYQLQNRYNELNNKNRELYSKIGDPNFISQTYADLRLDYLIKKGYTGTFRTDNIDGSPKIIGQLIKGKERGTWTYYYENGEKEKYKWIEFRVGATCCDGSRSYATGRGACSWHGGVCTWLYEYQRIKIE